MMRRSLAAAVIGLLAAAAAQAQTRWTVDPKASLVWWQMSPNLNHLWATTCPEERSWRPGENRSSGWNIDPKLKLPRSGYGNVDDTLRVPLFPRPRVSSVCSEAVEGRVVLPDTVGWRGAHGQVVVRSDALITGQAMRDLAMHRVLQTSQFPEIRFTLDSLVGLTKRADTLFCSAVGILTVRTMQEPTTAEVKAFPEAGGMRVLAKWRIPAATLQIDLVPKLHYMGLGANTLIWHDFFMGADLVFRPETPAAN
jgi:polyisoprenoid-binding protein YceI